MDNVKALLKRMKYELAEEQSSCTTHWSDEQFEDFANIIEDLEEAIKKDEKVVV